MNGYNVTLLISRNIFRNLKKMFVTTQCYVHGAKYLTLSESLNKLNYSLNSFLAVDSECTRNFDDTI